MGVVWKAIDTQLDREVAIKFLPQAFLTDLDRLARFEREAKLLASINHPNIATVYGLHEQGGTRFLAMELIPGQDLARHLTGEPLQLAQALSIGSQVAAALEATHERGVIHRDLKPANIYVTPDGHVKVLDFGIARDLEAEPEDESSSDSTGTQPGSILGTVDYMSPEQARGRPLDARTDLWSFGGVLYRMLAGKTAFDGETRWDKLVAVLRQEPDWEALPDETPGPVRELLERCLQKTVDDRLETAGEARRSLEVALATITSGELRLPMPIPDLEASVPSTPTGDTTGTAAMLVDRRPRPTIFRVLATIAIVFLIAWVGWTIRERMTIDSSPLPSPATVPRSVHSIAVLPFESVGGGEENDAFTAGIHDDILNRIAKIGDLKVISRTSVMEYQGTAKNLKQIGRELDVGAVLEGAVRRAGDQVRINVQLLDVATEENLWAESYNREVSVENILGIQSDIAERVATALQATLSAEERQRITALPTTDVKAYELYLQGLEFFNRPGQLKEHLVASRESFGRAVTRDPTFALAYTGLSRAARDHYWLGGGGPQDLDAALAAATRALELQPDLPEAHLALGTCLYVQRKYDLAQAEMNLALEGLPGHSELVRWMGYIARRQGDWDTALENLERARSLNPREVEATNEVGLTLLCMRRYGDAMPYFEQALDLAPDYPSARVYRALAPVLRDGTEESARLAVPQIDGVPSGPWKYAHGWRVHLFARDFEGAIELVSSVERVNGQEYNYPTPLLVGWTRLLQGRSDDAMGGFVEAASILEADVQADPDDARLRSALALAYAGMGRKEEALREGRLSVELLPLEKDIFGGTTPASSNSSSDTRVGRSDRGRLSSVRATP